MTDPQTASVLQEIVRRQSRSLLPYVGESFPWTNSRGQEALRQFRRVFDEDRRGLGALTQYLEHRRIPMPFLGAFPSWFTTINFVSLDYLLPKLVSAQQKEIADLERDLAVLADEDAGTQLQSNLELKRRHLQELESLAATRKAAAAVAG